MKVFKKRKETHLYEYALSRAIRQNWAGEGTGKATLWSLNPYSMDLLLFQGTDHLLHITSVYGHVTFTLGIWAKWLNTHWLHQGVLVKQHSLQNGDLGSLLASLPTCRISPCLFVALACHSQLLSLPSCVNLLILPNLLLGIFRSLSCQIISLSSSTGWHLFFPGAFPHDCISCLSTCSIYLQNNFFFFFFFFLN